MVSRTKAVVPNVETIRVFLTTKAGVAIRAAVFVDEPTMPIREISTL